VRDEQTGKLYTVGFTKNSALRRVPREVAEEFLRRREEMRQRAEQRRASAEANGGGTDAEREARRAERATRREGEGQRGEGRRRDGEGRGPDGQGRPREGGFGNIQQTLEALPLLAPAELRKGDALLVTGSPDAAGTRVTAASAYTGDPDFLRQLLRIQERRGPGEVNTGLPGDVLGGGNVNRDANAPTPPPR
jgi:hypothetical protein